MRIAISGYVGKKKTGIGRALENLLIYLPIAKDDEVHLYCNHDFDEFDFHGISGRITFHRFKVSKNSSILNLLWHQFIYPFKVLSIKAHVSYIPNVTLLLWKPCLTIVAIHDMIEFNVKRKFSWYRTIYRKFAVPLTAKRADSIITVSESSKQDILKYCGVPDEKVSVIYNGVARCFSLGTGKDMERIKQKYDLPDNYVLFVGTMDHPGKNVHSLIKACKSIWDRDGLDLGLVLCGQKGYGYEKIRDTIERDKRIIYLSYVEDSDLPVLYSGSRVFCFLSLCEGFGLPLIEAMACGIPVIASDRPPFPEIIGDAGIIVDPFDINEIGENIAKLATDDDTRRVFIARGLERAKSFSWERSAVKMYELLKREVDKNLWKRR